MIDHAGEMAAFVRVVEARGFSAAAPTLGLTPSAVSKLVTRLETRLGVRLLQRTTRALRLTPEGEVFYAAARRLVGELEALESLIAGQSGTPSGVLRVTTSLAFSTHQLAPVLSEFLDRHPMLSVELLPTDRVVDMVEEGIDVVGEVVPLGLAALRGHVAGVDPQAWCCDERLADSRDEEAREDARVEAPRPEDDQVRFRDRGDRLGRGLDLGRGRPDPLDPRRPGDDRLTVDPTPVAEARMEGERGRGDREDAAAHGEAEGDAAQERNTQSSDILCRR